MTQIHGNGIAPFRFLTPFPHRPPRRLRNSALKTCHFKPEVRTLPFFIRLILTCSNILGGRFHRLPSVDKIVAEKRCWGGSKEVCPLGRRTLPGVREGEAASREKASERWKGEGGALSPPRRIGKAKPERSLLPFPCILPTLSGRDSLKSRAS